MVTPADLADLAVRAAHASVRSQLCGLSLSPVLPDALPPRQMEVAVGQRPAAPAGDRRRGGRKGGGARGRAGAEGVALQSALSQEEPICWVINRSQIPTKSISNSDHPILAGGVD
eukprot:SAG25_NODE_26_length_21086_cov_21.643065_21_plen_115_part_00